MSETVIETEMEMEMNTHLMKTYNPLDISFTHGEGAWLFDANGKRYLDAYCGIAVTGLGHNYPDVTQAIQSQAANLLHTSQLVRIPQQEILANKLFEISKILHCDQMLFFVCNQMQQCLVSLESIINILSCQSKCMRKSQLA